MKKLIPVLFIILMIVFPLWIRAEDLPQITSVIVKARVVEVISEDKIQPEVLGAASGRQVTTQTIKAKILEGQDAGNLVELTNDYVMLKAGDTFYIGKTTQPDGTVQYTMNAPYRINTLLFFLFVFVLLVFLLGGSQGMRGLVSLAGSLLLIVFALIPGILGGFSPVLASLGVASLIIIAGSYITHGFNTTTTAAVAGMIITVAATGAMAYYAIGAAHLTGAQENAIYLNFTGQENIDLVGLFFGGILIGLLGVLYDIAISQAIAVEELRAMGPGEDKWHIYRRAIRIGKEHIGALVGTLAIAYVGAALPLILLYSKSGGSMLATINQEIFAAEIIRILISGIGLVLAVPITTFFAIHIILKKSKESKLSLP